MLESAGYPEGRDADRAGFDPTASGPGAEAVRTRTLVVVESPADLASRWPHLADQHAATGDLATLTAPLLVGDEPVGALHMAFRQPRSFDENDLSLARTLVRQGAQALERARLYEQEQLAREQAERLAGRLRRLQNVVDATFMSGALDDVLEELLVRLREAVDGDTAALLIVDDSGDVLIARKAVGFGRPLNTYVRIGDGFAGRIAATRTHQVIRDISQAHVVSSYFRESGIVSLAGVPLIADGRLIGVVHVGSKQMREFDREDILLLRLVAARAAVAIDRARIHEREHGIAEMLQRSLLPARLPAIDGIEVAARYVPGTVGVAVGGDWYDVFELADGSIGVVVGDVVGHGLRAAAAMGRLRNVLRAYALDGLGPGETLARLNRLACETDDEIFATVFYALLAPSRQRLRVASAGHPPPLLCSPGRPVRLLEEGRSLPLGADPEAEFIDAEVAIDPGSSLVLYTDGLVERRGESIDTGIERLVRLVEASDDPVDELADRIVDELESADHADDLALVAVRLEPVVPRTLSLRFPAEPRALAPVRASLRTWLERQGAGADEVFEILVAANEACSNAVEHPLGPTDTEVGLEAEVVNGALSIVVRDSGSWRPVRRTPDRGRGLDFMQTLMEDVEVVRSDDGTSVRLQRRLRGASQAGLP